LHDTPIPDNNVRETPAFAGVTVSGRDSMEQHSSPSMDARRVRSRKALRSALLALLEEKPFDQITIREITARAGVGYATFFRHYTAKDHLLNDLASGQIRDLLALSTPLLRHAGSQDAARALCTYVNDHRALWTALLTGGAAGTVREEFIRHARRIETDSVYDSGQHWLPGDLPIVFGAGGTIDILAWWLSQEKHHPAEDIARILDELVIAPVLRGTDLDSRSRDQNILQA
jgi:AcrR family transcriptional regulator